MALSRNEVEKVAVLARLKLTDAELDALTEQLSAVLRYVEQLDELDTEDVEPLAHVADLANVFRADKTMPSFARDTMLAGAPKTDGACYLTPAVLGE